MAGLSDRNHDDGRSNVDAYLDAFIAGGNKAPALTKPTLPEPVTQKISPPAPCDDLTEPELVKQHASPVGTSVSQGSTRFYPANDAIPSFKDFAVARDDMQQLLKFSRNSRPAGKSNRIARQGRFIRTACFAIALIVLPLGFYKHYDKCAATGTCLWSARLLGGTPSISPPKTIVNVEKTSETVIHNPFRAAVNTATTAVELGESAVTEEDWRKVTDKWLEAINLMQSVPESSPRYEIAQQKAQEYIGYLASVQKQALLFNKARTETIEEEALVKPPSKQACSSLP